MESCAGATSGILKRDNEIHLPPPTRGPLPVVDETVAGRAGDTHGRHTARTRDAARGQARSCQAERADLDTLAATISLALPQSPGRVGVTLAVEWSGNTLEDRIPVWIVASTPAKVRNIGMGAMTLGPQSAGPFGISHAEDETRAFVSLWSRGAGRAGRIEIMPLEAGQMDLDLSVVAWLRACDTEVLLKSQQATIAIAHAPARLVVGTPGSRSDLTHVQDIPAMDRRVVAGQARFRITTLNDETEILERAGGQVRLSPTGRFPDGRA